MSTDLLHEQKDVLDVKRSYFNAICRGLNTINKNFINNFLAPSSLKLQRKLQYDSIYIQISHYKLVTSSNIIKKTKICL